MNEEHTKADPMRWDDHFKAGVEDLRDEVREKLDARETMRDVRHHTRAAMKELLLAWRSAIDGVIRTIDEADKPRTQRVTKIKIE